MRKDRFYLVDITKPCFSDIEDIHKIKNILRKREGDVIFIFDGNGKEYKAKIVKIDRRNIEFKIEKVEREEIISESKISLAFSLIKSNKVDFLLQKSVELGADEFIPFISQNTVVKSPSKSKYIHWQKVIKESAAQSHRLFLPQLRENQGLDNLISGFGEYSLVLIADPYVDLSITESLKDKDFKNVLLLIGPEGGFAENEIGKFQSAIRVKLSDNILRAETAAMFFVGMVRSCLK